MNGSDHLEITVDYDSIRQSGELRIASQTGRSIWDRICQSAAQKDECRFSDKSVTLPWPSVLSLIREFAPQQKLRGFRLIPTSAAKPRVEQFVAQYKLARQTQSVPPPLLSTSEITEKLKALGFTKRVLRPFQIRDLKRLLALPNGANFSVPGAGKTTVTLALHLLTWQEDQKLVVVSPKSAFPAWREVVDECIGDSAQKWVKEPFYILTGGSESVSTGFRTSRNRFVINYEQLLIVPDLFSSYLAQNRVHLVLDESHRMKGGLNVRRGVVLLNSATLPVRRDILSGTPMPQSPTDLRAQLDFLWPGTDLGLQIDAGHSPQSVIGNFYVRTTKADLGLPPAKRRFIPVSMSKGQAAFYAVVRDELLRNSSTLRTGSGVNLDRARRSVMRLLQLSANPVIAVKSILESSTSVESGILQQVLDEGPSKKMIEVRDFARKLAENGKKCVIWTIFTETINQMERMLADINPVTIYGAVPSGDSLDPDTREGRIKRFHEDQTCMVLIANPAAAGEGISLHHVCHDAIYLDRSFNTTHYLQSIDRIHRLGLPDGIETNIHVFLTTVPKGLGCVDHSVSRRLAVKLRAMQQLLDDVDLHRIALNEEEVDGLVEDLDHEDLVDLIAELEGSTNWDKDKAV